MEEEVGGGTAPPLIIPVARLLPPGAEVAQHATFRPSQRQRQLKGAVEREAFGHAATPLGDHRFTRLMQGRPHHPGTAVRPRRCSPSGTDRRGISAAGTASESLHELMRAPAFGTLALLSAPLARVCQRI